MGGASFAQKNIKFQYSMTKTQNRFGISNFGHCDLFDICDFLFGISKSPLANSPSLLANLAVPFCHVPLGIDSMPYALSSMRLRGFLQLPDLFKEFLGPEKVVLHLLVVRINFAHQLPMFHGLF